MIKSFNEVKSAYNGTKELELELGLIVQGLALVIIALLLIGLFVLLAFFPLITIWSLNTLFATGIAYNFTNWFAVVFIQATIRGLTKSSK